MCGSALYDRRAVDLLARLIVDELTPDQVVVKVENVCPRDDEVPEIPSPRVRRDIADAYWAIAIAEPDDEDWFATAQGALDSLTLGPPSEHPNPRPVATPDDCIEAGAEISGTVLLEAYGGTRLVAEMPVDVASSKRFPRTEIYEVGTFAVGFFVLGPLDESPDFADAASARDHALGERPTLSKPVLEGFGSEAVGAIVESGDASGSATALRTFSLDGGADQATISTGDAFWFFDTEQGVFLVRPFPDSSGSLDASLAMANSIVPTMELVEGLCD
jgi:hypothetical protein